MVTTMNQTAMMAVATAAATPLLLGAATMAGTMTNSEVDSRVILYSLHTRRTGPGVHAAAGPKQRVPTGLERAPSRRRLPA